MDDHLVIIGAGGVGGSAVHIAPAAVAGKLIVADLDAQKRAQARQMGAVATIDNSAPDAVKQVMEATDGGAAAAIDFVGSPKTMEFGVNILRKGGKLVMVGLYGGACPISTVLFPFKMMTIEGSYVGTLEELKELLALVQAGRVPPIPVESRPADQASAALSDLKSGGKVHGEWCFGTIRGMALEIWKSPAVVGFELPGSRGGNDFQHLRGNRSFCRPDGGPACPGHGDDTLACGAAIPDRKPTA